MDNCNAGLNCAGNCRDTPNFPFGVKTICQSSKPIKMAGGHGICSYGSNCGGGGGQCSYGSNCGGGGGQCSYGSNCGGGGGQCSYGSSCSGS